jgi:hypothetical protein
MRNSIWLKSNNGSMYNIEFYEKDSLGGVSMDSLDLKQKKIRRGMLRSYTLKQMKTMFPCRGKVMKKIIKAKQLCLNLFMYMKE